MSLNNLIEAVEDNSQQTPWNILADHKGIKIDEKFVLKLTKGSKHLIKEVKDSCKVFNFSSEWNFEEVLTSIDELDSKDFPQAFIFTIQVINHANFSDKFTKLKEKVLKFGSARPMILQMTSEDENESKIYYKEESAALFIVFDQQHLHQSYAYFWMESLPALRSTFLTSCEVLNIIH